MIKNLFAILFVLAAGVAMCPNLAAQGNSTGPMSTAPPRTVMRIPANSSRPRKMRSRWRAGDLDIARA
jgi:hypothetical protein